MIKLTFLGGAGTVTGSKFLLDNGRHRILIDCGLFQGYKALRLKNWSDLPLAPSSISAVVLTHAHLDHTGYLPRLVKGGFRGAVYCTPATASLCEILLPDSGHLQERDAADANRNSFSKHHPALPLYTQSEAETALDHLRPVAFGNAQALPGGARITFLPAGHILGAATVVLEWEGCRIGFSGDIGRYGDPLMPNPIAPRALDYLLMESTYGDRRHDATKPQDALVDIITKTIHRGGTIIVPAFAVGRAQSLLYHVSQLKAAGRLPALLPVFLDSPMAIDATELFVRHSADHRLDAAQVNRISEGVHYVRTGRDSRKLTASAIPKIIISASGMATGGRVLHHLEHYAPDPRNGIIFAGFQAGGTRGAALVAGADSIKMHGRYIPVRASVHNLSMLSAHADRDELLRWAGKIGNKPQQTFIVHGEPNAADALRRCLEERLGWSCVVPDHLQQAIFTTDLHKHPPAGSD